MRPVSAPLIEGIVRDRLSCITKAAKAVGRGKNRRDRRKWINQTGKRQSVIIVRERNGRSLPAVFKSEGAALSWIKSRVNAGTILNADEASSWNDLGAKYEMKRINHQEAYSDGEACTNLAESYFSRLRRAEMGHHHHVSGPYLLRYAQESAWREDARRVDNGALLVTWAIVGQRQADGIERYMGDWHPLVGTAFPDVAPIAVNTPW